MVQSDIRPEAPPHHKPMLLSLTHTEDLKIQGHYEIKRFL